MIYVLLLNPMQGRAEDADPVAWSENREALVQFMKEQLNGEPYVEVAFKYQAHDTDQAAQMSGPYVETIDGYEWHKVFAKGSPLEWYNPPAEGRGIIALEGYVTNGIPYHVPTPITKLNGVKFIQ